MNKRRHIVVVTGTRAEYGIIHSVLEEIHQHPQLKLSLVVMAQHLAAEFGYTIQEIERDDFEIAATVETVMGSDSLASMAKSVGLGILGLAQELERLRPDAILITGDRGEMLAAAITGAHMNVAVAHLHGGEISGTVDEMIRHAITKLAHLHFPATGQSAVRIERLGEDRRRIFVVGAAGLDQIKKKRFFSEQKLREKFEIDFSKPIILVSQHPVTTEFDQAAAQMRETMEAIKTLGHQTILLYPNSDAGGRAMREAVDACKGLSNLEKFHNVSREFYLGLMSIADVMVGNTSSGIIEAPSFHLPFVNIGTRQKGRERSRNVIDVDYNRNEICRAVDCALHDVAFRESLATLENPYGDGKTGKRVAKLLAEIELGPEIMQKQISY